MLKFNTTLGTTLNGASTKLDWSSKVQLTLGNTRRVKGYKDASSSATDPATSGTVFLNIGNTGALTVVGGNITGIGTSSGTTTLTPVDLLTGTSVLRIEGNGNWIEGTVGYSRAVQTAKGVTTANLKDYDFTLHADLSATSGVGFTNSINILAPKFLPSGTGAVAPVKVATSPARYTIEDWTNPATPSVVVNSAFSVREDDWVYEDAEMAAGNGDSSVYSTAADSIWGNYLSGGLMTISDKSNTVTGVNHLHAVSLTFAYRSSTYTAWPERTGYDRKNSILTLPPFKAKLWDGNGNLLYTWEMPDGLPLNDPSLRSGLSGQNSNSDTQALHPRFNIGEGLYWESDAPRVSDIASKVLPGIEYRESMGKGYMAYNGVESVITSGYEQWALNGIAHHAYAPEFPQKKGAQAISDAYIDPVAANSGTNGCFIEGYGYIPGGFGLHNPYTPPGGPRQARGVWPSVFAAFMNDPNGNRLQGNVPWRVIADGYRKSYWNLPVIRVHSPTAGLIDPDDELCSNWTTGFNYYGDPDYGTRKVLVMNGDQRGGTQDPNYDAAGNVILNGVATDGLHAYENAHTAALLFNSMHMSILGKHHTLLSFIIYGDPSANSRDDYLVRSESWKWLHHILAWKCASTHPRSISRAKLENRFNKILDAEYRYSIKPTFIDNDQSGYSVSMRNLGVPLVWNGDQYWTAGGFLGFYTGFVMALAKQTGFWSRMKNMSPQNAMVLDMKVRNLDKFNFEFLLYTNGRPQFATYSWFGADIAQLPTSWAAWQASRTDKTSVGDMIHDENGNLIKDADIAWNIFMAYPLMRKRYFPEYPNPAMDLAIAKVAAYEKVIDDNVTAATTPVAKTAADWGYRNPNNCRLKAPAVLGPA